MDWYVAYCKPGGELRARTFMQAEGAEVYLPLYRRMISHAGKKELALRPVFPRYLFFKEFQIHKANSTPGVSQVVKFGNDYVVIGDDVVSELRDREDETGAITFDPTPYIPPLPHKGGLVRLTDGPFEGSIAVFDGLTEDNRVRVLLNILRRQISLDLPIHGVDGL